jgi:hypothetical protein
MDIAILVTGILVLFIGMFDAPRHTREWKWAVLPTVYTIAGVVLCALALSACNTGRYTVQDAPTQASSGETVDTLTGLGFAIDSADSARVVTNWERYNVGPVRYALVEGAYRKVHNEVSLRIIVDKGQARGECAERSTALWYFRPCKNQAALARISQAIEAL